MADKKITRKAVKSTKKKKSTTGVTKKTPSTSTSKRKKRLRLTSLELNLLEYPPTEKTWECSCHMFNSGNHKKCWQCGKPPTDKLLYPIYVDACVKVGIEPGHQWKVSNKMAGIFLTRPPKSKWVPIELPEGLSYK